MQRYLWGFLGFVAGFLLSIAGFISVEIWSAFVHPFPEGVELTHEVICAHVEKYPAAILLAVTAIYACIVAGSSWCASAIGGRVPGLTITALLLAGILFNMSMLPYPLWFEIANGLAFPASGLVGVWLGAVRRSKAGSSSSTSNQPETKKSE